MAQGVWIDQGQDPNFDRLKKYGITVPYFDSRDPKLTPQYLDWVRGHDGIEACGIYTAWNWNPSFIDPRRYAEWTDLELRRIGWQGNARVILDIEKGHGLSDQNYVGYVISVLTRWRQLRPSRETMWTLEGMQGGLFSPQAALTITNTRVRVAPQFYTGNMVPHPHSVMLDLMIAGFVGGSLDGMYDAAALPYKWRGIAYTQGRLP